MKPRQKTILAVDDRETSLKVLAAILGDVGYEVIQAAGPQKALDIFTLRSDIDAVLSDLKMPGMDGLELFKRLNSLRQAPPFIIMTAYGTVKSAVAALKEGVAHYLIKPLDYDELAIVLEKAIRESEIRRELSDLKAQVAGPHGFHGLIGTTDKMRDVFAMVRTVGPTDASVLIYGETGTGKELLARAVHLESRRAAVAMVCIIEVIGIHLPPLRERRDDIYPLARHFIRIFNSQYERRLEGITPQAMAVLLNYPWPGNIRELKNAVARAVILSKTRDIDVADLPENIRHQEVGPTAPVLALEQRTLKDVEKEMIRLALVRCAGNKSLAAQSLGISRKTLYEKLVRHGLSGQDADKPTI
jgi:DNA-binding NtrC family response regulator